MDILVTGGAGYIGSHTVVALIEAGHTPYIVDNYSNSSPAVLDAIRKITGVSVPAFKFDVQDESKLNRLFSRVSFDAVIHFAGLKAVAESVERPLEYYDNNLQSAIVLLRTMRKHYVNRIVFSSSATVYGPKNPVPFTEGMDTCATNPYGWTKVMIEQIIRDVCVAIPDMSAVMLRYFNPVGAHPSGLIGENPNGIPNNLVPYIQKVATGDLPHLNVTGTDYDTPDGTGVRDYLHVVDLAQAHVKAVDYTLGKTGSVEINVGTGKGESVLNMLHAYERACGKTLPYVAAPRRAGDIAECFADTRKAKELLGWEAKLGVDDMCRDSWRFVSQN
ncbi:MAG: UDP-glucose 4-epimerase GalE [Oscillospiraceae bacterium]|jgi:UDP-glucose 4-epimerase|nr:UDP-glucose 4-epimerase GalE [Oscillospiraceae bacterium]